MVWACSLSGQFRDRLIHVTSIFGSGFVVPVTSTQLLITEKPVDFTNLYYGLVHILLSLSSLDRGRTVTFLRAGSIIMHFGIIFRGTGLRGLCETGYRNST